MFGDDELNREDTHADFTPKASWRKLIELRVFARVAGEDGVAARAGVPHVHEKVYEYVEEALQARLKGFVARVQLAAKHRNDGNKRLLPREKMAVREPRSLVRRVNVDAEREAAARAEKERQKLLRVGETFLSKRKRARGGEGDAGRRRGARAGDERARADGDVAGTVPVRTRGARRTRARRLGGVRRARSDGADDDRGERGKARLARHHGRRDGGDSRRAPTGDDWHFALLLRTHVGVARRRTVGSHVRDAL